MKKLIIMSALVMGGLGITTANAQFGIHINLHLGNRPVYVPAQPVEVSDQPVYNDDYYYLPDIEAFYSLNERCYYYQDGDRWVSAAFLPGRYHDFDWRYAKYYKIHANRPYMHNEVYRSRFGGYINRNDYYARAYPDRAHYRNEDFRGHDQYDNNRGWGEQNGGYDRHNDYNQNAYNQQNHGSGYNQPNQGGYNQGSYNQPAQNQNQGGYSQSAPNPGRNQGGYNGNSNGTQPSQGQQGGRGNGQGSSQPANHNGGQSSGSYTGADHYAANKMGVVQDRGEFARPVRN